MSKAHKGYLEKIHNMMDQNKDVSAIEQIWVEMKETSEKEALLKKDLLEEKYKKLYPETEIAEIKVGGFVVDTYEETIPYIVYSEEKAVPVLDEIGLPVLDPETGDIKTELKPVIPDEYYNVVVDEKTGESKKVLITKYENAPMKPTLKYYIKKQTQSILNDITYDIDMDKFVPFVKPYMIKLVNVEFSKAMSAITKQYPEHEQMTWDQQEYEARAYKADPKNAQIPLIANIAKGRGVDVSTLVDKIIAKADAYKQAAGLAIGYRQDAEGHIAAITTYAEYTTLVKEFEAERNLFYKVVGGK